MRKGLALLTVVAAAYSAVPAAAVHESHHGPFIGTTAQGERLVMRVTSHTRIGIRFRWRGTCEHGTVLRIARFRSVPVSEDGRFFKRGAGGIGVRGKIGFDPQGNPVAARAVLVREQRGARPPPRDRRVPRQGRLPVRTRHLGGAPLAVALRRRRAAGLDHLDHVAPAVGPGAVGVGEAVLLRELPARERLRRSSARRRGRPASAATARPTKRGDSEMQKCGVRSVASRQFDSVTQWCSSICSERIQPGRERHGGAAVLARAPAPAPRPAGSPRSSRGRRSVDA